MLKQAARKPRKHRLEAKLAEARREHERCRQTLAEAAEGAARWLARERAIKAQLDALLRSLNHPSVRHAAETVERALHPRQASMPGAQRRRIGEDDVNTFWSAARRRQDDCEGDLHSADRRVLDEEFGNDR